MSTPDVRYSPILFQGDMVRGILDGSKTMTRRVVRLPKWSTGDPNDVEIDQGLPEIICENTGCFAGIPSPYGYAGDRLWVREAVYIDQMPFDRGPLPKDRPGDVDERSIYYRADGECCDQIPECSCGEVGPPRWRPSIHMPRWASRITMEVTELRVERVQEISLPDIAREGVTDIDGNAWDPEDTARATDLGRSVLRGSFEVLWDSINGPRGFGWGANPWVWVIGFRQVDL